MRIEDTPEYREARFNMAMSFAGNLVTAACESVSGDRQTTALAAALREKADWLEAGAFERAK